MAKKPKPNKEGDTNMSEAETTAAPAASTTATSDDRYKMVTLQDGSTMKRIDFIRKRWTEDKVARGAIAKELTELTGKKVPYQIVFAATKGIAGGPAKEAVATPGEGAQS